MDPKPIPSLNLLAWQEELGEDPDRTFILEGIRDGFDIIDPTAQLEEVEMANHRSALDNSEQVLAQIREEIAHDNYVVTTTKPIIVSALGAVPKPDGRIRLIHDCSVPPGRAVNDYAPAGEKLKFQSVDDAARLLTPGCYMAKVDLKSAYRSVDISISSQRATGLKWSVGGHNIYFYDKKLCFGSSKAPGIFHRIT